MIGFGPTVEDEHHGIEGPDHFPMYRLSSYWSLVLAVICSLPEIWMHKIRFTPWGFSLHWVITLPLSIIGFYVLNQLFCEIRRQQGDSETTFSPEPRPPVLINKISVDADIKEMTFKAALAGLIPSIIILSFLLYSRSKWVLITTIALSVLCIIPLIVFSKKASTAFSIGWEEKKERTEFCNGLWMFLGANKPQPMMIDEMTLPSEEELEYSEEEDAEPYLNMVVYTIPPGTTYDDFAGLGEQLKAELNVNDVAISPIGVMETSIMGEQEEKLGTIGPTMFRVFYPTDEDILVPKLNEPCIDDRMLDFAARAKILPALEKIKGIGRCVLVETNSITKEKSPEQILEVVVIPVRPEVSISNFLDNTEAIKNQLGIEWVRTGFPRSLRGQKVEGFSILLGDEPQKTTKFKSPPSIIDKRILDLNWSYYFHSSEIRTKRGLPTGMSVIETTPTVTKLSFYQPDGMEFREMTEKIEVLKASSGHAFIEFAEGEDSNKKQEDDYRTRFTITVARQNPLNRMFTFNNFKDKILTEREPGKAKINWYTGVLSDDNLVGHDFPNGGEEPHLLIAGSSGSGKSVVINSMICQLAYKNGPDELQIGIIEPKNELQIFKNLDVCKWFVDSFEDPSKSIVEKSLELAETMYEEMERRNNVFTSHPKQPKKLSQARKYAVAESKKNGTDLKDHDLYMPYIIFIIEECATLFYKSSIKEERPVQQLLISRVTELARKARSTGIYIVAATQYPTSESIPSTIKQQMARIGLKTANSLASKVIIEETGLEKIKIKGAGMIKEKGNYRLFRGFFMAEGDPDEGEENDVLDMINLIPTKTGIKTNSTNSVSRITVPKIPNTFFEQWQLNNEDNF